MRIALVLTPMSDHNLQLAAQVGATDIVGRFPGTKREDLRALCDRVASYGLKLSVIEGYIPHDRIVHGMEERDEQIAAKGGLPSWVRKFPPRFTAWVSTFTTLTFVMCVAACQVFVKHFMTMGKRTWRRRCSPIVTSVLMARCGATTCR